MLAIAEASLVAVRRMCSAGLAHRTSCAWTVIVMALAL